MLVDHNDALDLFQVPFMRRWLQARRQFSVSAWFKRAAGTSGRVGIVNNGNWSLCDVEGEGSFLIDMDDDDVIGGLAIKNESLQETSGYTVRLFANRLFINSMSIFLRDIYFIPDSCSI